ncbi:MAG TPA: DUF3300 domain-containing protein [Candidatus Binatia bacterium]|jgi:uncharacterized membrane protein YgcG
MHRILRLSCIWLVVLFLAAPPPRAGGADTPAPAGPPAFKPEEIDQLLAPIALYPDELISQVLMAATYPLEVVEADRWAKQNKNVKGDALGSALEKQTWDPSVKSLVNFPDVLAMMSDKLDWTQKLGDAFLSQQDDVMNGVQRLRAQAQKAGNLQTTEQQKVVVEQQVIKIEPANPQVVYVPTYNPTVVYGAWAYPAYPPYPVYPAGYVAGAAVAGAVGFASGVALGAAWGYAWGGADWHNHKVKVNINQNINYNNKINRNNYTNINNKNWEHNSDHRKGVSYRNESTAQRYNRGSDSQAARSREEYRGRTEQARQDYNRNQGQRSNQDFNRNQGQRNQAQRTNVSERSGGNKSGAFEGVQNGGNAARSASQRGSASRSGGGGHGGGGGGGGGRRR